MTRLCDRPSRPCSDYAKWAIDFPDDTAIEIPGGQFRRGRMYACGTHVGFALRFLHMHFGNQVRSFTVRPYDGKKESLVYEP